MATSSNIPLAALPIGQLESTKFKITQLMESVTALQRIVEAGGYNVMPAWPDILAKYNVLLSQTHNLSISLVSASTSQLPHGIDTPTSSVYSKSFAKLALHPSSGFPDAQLDNDLIPLLRNQQTTEVLRLESDTVRRLSERLPTAATQKEHPNTVDTYRAVLKECDLIKTEHDSGCERAVRAVTLLREKYDWKARVAVETEEPEDFVPLSSLSPQHPLSPFNRLSPVPRITNSAGDDIAVDTPDDNEGDDDDSGDDDAELEEVLGPSLQPSPGADESASSTPH
ncbi:hypothetical protein EW145_g3060 [Phellinidium pouzarii]|uniref:Mediator complex subunit 8 n=1 Tax=Phellinidium pouzarii TaxID=167371 RepID=A0A4S4L8G4_9AGAM|nr:hypothetical protein EW145_g3060 [Phellinidium pouzarii]